MSDDDKFVDVIRGKKALHFQRMAEVIDDDMEELSMETFHKTMELMRKKHGSKYDFIVKAGQSLKLALLNLYRIIWKTENLPQNWEDSTVTQIPKSKGLQKDLNMIRHIHDKNIFSKYFGQMVLTEAKENLFKNLPKFQIACRPGHRSSEHLFVLKSIFAKYRQ